MSEFEKELNRIPRNGATERDEGFYLYSNLVRYFKDWQPPKPLVEVPQFVGDWIEYVKEQGYNALGLLDNFEMPNEISNWLFSKDNDHNINTVLSAWIDGYTVEKEQLYVLKHIDMSKEDSIYDWYVYRDLDDNRLWHASLSKCYDMSKATIYHFTQAEIEKLHTGSYEQIEVKFVEVEE